MDFGQALAALKSGQRVARAGWNGRIAGKSTWLWLIVSTETSPSPLPPGVTEDEWRGFRGLPWIGLKTADDGFVPWLASQTDLLSEDYEVVE